MPSPEETAGGDPLARTQLGRQRSALAMGVVAGLLVHDRRLLAVVAGLLLAAFAAFAWSRRVPPGALTAATLVAAAVAALVVAP